MVSPASLAVTARCALNFVLEASLRVKISICDLFFFLVFSGKQGRSWEGPRDELKYEKYVRIHQNISNMVKYVKSMFQCVLTYSSQF